MDSRYITSFAHVQQLRSLGHPEVAFIGRSNCGKSSLLNALLQRKNLAKTSSRPGRTQMIHLFLWNHNLIFADLPGYGYQKTPQSVVRTWQPLIRAYLAREELKACLCLQDIRRDFPTEDLEYFAQLAQKNTVKIILTKSDKISRSEQRQRLKILRPSLPNTIELMAVSARTGLHIPELREELWQRWAAASNDTQHGP